MSAAEKLSFKVGEVTFKAPTSFVAKAVLAAVSQQPNKARQVTHDSPPALGLAWPGQGGVYVGTIRGDEGQPDYHLIAPTLPFKKDKVEWGNYGKEIPGANSKRDGLANTKAMASAGLELAKEILAWEIDGHADFYMASQCEAALCYANAPEQFEAEAYWTSTQYSSSNAWFQSFGGGYSNLSHKDSTLRVCAVRRFLANSPI